MFQKPEPTEKRLTPTESNTELVISGKYNKTVTIQVDPFSKKYPDTFETLITMGYKST